MQKCIKQGYIEQFFLQRAADIYSAEFNRFNLDAGSGSSSGSSGDKIYNTWKLKGSVND